jgi:NAD(P)-dependent dehydrogenase (short-subunit alcohol dehydrogenase family)
MAQRAWFITGVNSGFGREMTEQLLERGDRVAGTVRNLDSVRDLTEKYGDRFWTADIEPQKDLAASTDFAATPDGPR